MRFLFLFTLHQSVDVLRKFANSVSKVIMLRCNRYSGVQEHLFILKQSPIRKLESCESRFLWKKWKFFAYHLEDLRVPLVVRVPQVGNPWYADQGRNEGKQRRNNFPKINMGAPKSPNNVTSTFFNTVHLLPKDLSFEHGALNLLLILDAI